MPQKFLRKYGVAATLPFTLFDIDGVDFQTGAAHASGDTKVMKDEGAEANTTNGFTDEGTGYAIVLSATEMEAKRNVVYIVDQGEKAWLDDYIVIESYGHANAMHPFDLGADLSGNNVNWKFKSIDITNDAGDGLTCKSTGGNGKGLNIVGHGTSPGVNIEGGVTGNGIDISTTDGTGINVAVGSVNNIGVNIAGGATGNGLVIAGGIEVYGAVGGSAVKLAGSGAGHGLEIEGGATGNGISILGGSTSGKGIEINTTNGDGIDVSPGGNGHALNLAATTGAGLNISSGGGFPGVAIAGNGNGHGLQISGGNTANGLDIQGGSTSGDGIRVEATNGTGLKVVSTNERGIEVIANQTALYLRTSNSGYWCTQLSSNGMGLNILASNGSGISINAGNEGIVVVGGTSVITAPGVLIQGGSDGHGLIAEAGGGNNHGFTMIGKGTGKDIDALEIDALLAGVSLIDGKIDIIDTNIDLIIAKLPSGDISDFALTDTIDGIAVSVILEYMMAMFNGKFNEDDPAPGKKTFFKRNNITELSVVQVDETGRQRIS